MTISFNMLGHHGRLGNRMFQYATLKSISQKHGYDFTIPPSNFNDPWHDHQLFEGFELCSLPKENIKYNQNNKKQGEWIWYMPKQQLEMKGSFENNKQHGRWEYYFSSGELSYIAYFDNDKKTGTWNYFYKDGNKFKTGNYVNDEKEGRWQTWYEDGTLLMSGLYEKGKEEGEWINYWGNGHPKNKASLS